MPPSLADVQARAQGRPRAVLDRVLAILEADLPSVLSAVGLPAVDTFDYAGTHLDVGALPAVRVAYAVDTQDFEGGFVDTHSIQIYYHIAHMGTKDAMRQALDVASCIRATIFAHRVDKPVWFKISPRSISAVPRHLGLHEGFVVSCDIAQPPGRAGELWGSLDNVSSIDADDILADRRPLGRPSKVLDQLVSVLSSELPAVLSSAGLPALTTIDWAGIEWNKPWLPALELSLQNNSTDYGTTHADLNIIRMSVLHEHQPVKGEMQKRLDTITLARALLDIHRSEAPYWNLIAPRGLNVSMQRVGEFEGYEALVNVHQPVTPTNAHILWGI